MAGPVTLTPVLNQANFGTGVYGTAKYGQYIVTLNSGVLGANSTSPEFGLTQNFQYAAGQLDNNNGFTGTQRSHNIVLAGELTLPSSFSGDAECIWEFGGTGVGSWLGIAIINGAYFLRFRAGEGASSVQDNTAGDIALANVAISSIPEFDGNTHTMVWEIKPGAAGRIRLWIDGRNIIDQETSGGAQLESGRWGGGDVGGWGQGFSSIAGDVTASGSGGTRTQNQAATAFSGTIQSNLRVYNNQLVGALTPLAQPNVTEILTGVAATGAIGTVEDQVTDVIAGVSATGAIGTVKPNVTEIISGVSATGQIGTVEDKPTEILTGVAGTGAVGTVTIANTVTLSGVAATGSIGTVEDKVTEILTGVSATGGIGAFTIANTAGLSGVAGTTNTPAVEPQITEKISGVAGTTALGDVTLLGADTDVPVVGVAATGAVGTVSANPGAGLTGVAATGAIGTVAPNTTFAISVSASATGAVNTVTANTGTTLTGVVGTGAVAPVTAGTGTLEVDVLESLSGVSATGSVAGVEVKVTEILASVSATGQVGSITVGVGAGLTGVEATGQVAELEVGTGTLEVDVVEILASVDATTSIGTVKPNVTKVLSTNLLTGSVGTVSTTAVQFDFEAVKDAYDRSRTVYITGFTESAKDRRVYVQRETRKIYVERFSTAAERRVRTSKAA